MKVLRNLSIRISLTSSILSKSWLSVRGVIPDRLLTQLEWWVSKSKCKCLVSINKIDHIYHNMERKCILLEIIFLYCLKSIRFCLQNIIHRKPTAICLSIWYKGKIQYALTWFELSKWKGYFTENKAGDISEGALTRVTFPKSHNPNP